MIQHDFESFASSPETPLVTTPITGEFCFCLVTVVLFLPDAPLMKPLESSKSIIAMIILGKMTARGLNWPGVLILHYRSVIWRLLYKCPEVVHRWQSNRDFDYSRFMKSSVCLHAAFGIFDSLQTRRVSRQGVVISGQGPKLENVDYIKISYLRIPVSFGFR